jgi:serine phosphatase RsbU (regulator of sigma subunit)
VIDSKEVSREHARVFRDPFGRWVFEDLGSSNGTFINGQRVEASAVLPGEVVLIGPASLSISQLWDHQVTPPASTQATNIVVEDFETEVFYRGGKVDDFAVRPFPEQLNEITARLSELTSLSALYPEVCRYLARAPKTVAAVLRVPQKNQPIPKTPEVIACHFGVSLDDTAKQMAVGSYPSCLAFRVSHRVLDAVRSTGEAMMAKSIYSSDTEVTMTFVDEHSPRAAICAVLGEGAAKVDLLYLDIPIDGEAKADPEEMFAFVRLVAQEVASARKNLTPMHVKSERSALDRELWLAHQLQMSLAPNVLTDLTGVDVAVAYKPVVWVAGDYCDLWRLEDGRLAFGLGHVSDKGLPAAMAISNLRTLVRTTTSLRSELSDIVKHVNSHLMGSFAERVSATLFLGLFDASTGTLSYVNAGHPEPLIVHPKLGVTTLGKSAQAMLGQGQLSLTTNIEILLPTAVLVLFSEGVVDAQSPRLEKFGLTRLNYLLKTTPIRSAKQIVDSITKAVKDFQQRVAQYEDMSILALRNG